MIKSGPQGETAYVNQFFVVRNREVATKHVFAGGTRLVSKMASQPDVTPPTAGNSGQAPWGWLHSNAGGNSPNAGGTVFEKDQYYFHPDHLGSSSYVTDIDGEIFQHLEYFPFGETFVEESSNTQRTPYLFTGKELDEETGLYYFGARYYDPRTSVWQSADPILAGYMGGKGSGGGVFRPVNLNLYGYVQQNPVRFVDPSGLDTVNCSDVGGVINCYLRRSNGGIDTLNYNYEGNITSLQFHNMSMSQDGGWVNNSADASLEEWGQRVQVHRNGAGISDQSSGTLYEYGYSAEQRDASWAVAGILLMYGTGSRTGGNPLRKLPLYDGNSTIGILKMGNQQVPLRSGIDGGPGMMLRNDPNIRAGNVAWTHTEGHAAAYMRLNNIRNAELYINNPNGVCGYCRSVMQNMLPEGSTLKVYWPGGSKTYTGLAD